MQNKLTSVIICYYSAATIANLLSVLRMVYSNHPVIVIDNASADQTADIVACDFPEVQLVRNRQNLGYARTINLGIGLSSTAYGFILNPDIRIQSHRMIADMMDIFDDSPTAGETGPIKHMIKNERNHLNFICSYLDWNAFRGYLYFQKYHAWQSQDPIRVPLLNAGCIMIRLSAFMQIGEINPRYFLYGEDPDLGLKLHHHGFECWLLPGVSVIHYRESSQRTLNAKQR